jgi:hypothetical protein
LADGVKLGMLPGSHKIVAQNGYDKLCRTIDYGFKVGEILIFHPLFVHYGCAYTASDESLRIHFYFDNDQLIRSSSDRHQRTFFFNLVVRKNTFPEDIQRGKKKKSLRGANLRKLCI